ncbi:MAG: cobalamin biosynthesis protein [Clostridia bacterium]
MNVNIFAYSDKGCQLAIKISEIFDNVSCFALQKFAEKYSINPHKSTGEKVKELFDKSDLLVFVGACGIAVRAIAPLVKSKTSDPACIVIDDCANFVIPILSGHIGGANEFCKIIAEKTGATPVISTATDVNEKFSVDTFATKQNLFISSMSMAKNFSAEILKGNLPICFCEEIKAKTSFSNGIFESDSGKIGAYIGYKKIKPFEKTLRLVPKILSVGIGCRKNIEKEKIENLFFKTLNENNIDINAIKSIASIDIKSEEKGLLEFCEEQNFGIEFFSAKELLSLKGEFTASNFVKSITGVDNVCERSAVKIANSSNLIVKKTSLDGVTIAIASEEKEIYFE